MIIQQNMKRILLNMFQKGKKQEKRQLQQQSQREMEQRLS